MSSAAAEDAASQAMDLPPGGTGQGWLWVEAEWTRVTAATNLAMEEGRTWGEAARAAAAVQAIAVCRVIERDLIHAPVNGTELAEDCVPSAGMARDLVDYVRLVRRVLGLSAAGADKPVSARAIRLYRAAAPECARMDGDKKGYPVVPVNAQGRGAYCAGHAADALDSDFRNERPPPTSAGCSSDQRRVRCWRRPRAGSTASPRATVRAAACGKIYQ